MKLFGDARSTNTRKVLTTFAELDMPYELVNVDFILGEHKHDTHLQRQPFGQLPALQDEDFNLYETHAICRYLDARAGGRLLPKDPRGRALVDQWMSIESANFSGHAMRFVYHYLLRMQQDPLALEHSGAGLDKALAILDRQLSGKPFVAGDEFTLADICFMPYFEYALLTPAEVHFSKYPRTMAWWNRVRERSSWRKVAARPSEGETH